jgi:hypothetical protein
MQADSLDRAGGMIQRILNLSDFPSEGQRSLLDWLNGDVKTSMLCDESGEPGWYQHANGDGDACPLFRTCIAAACCIPRPRSAGGRESDYAGPML